MFFTVNLAFLDHLENLPEVLDTPIDRNWMHDNQILPISLESFEINSSLLQAPKMLKGYTQQLQEHNKKSHVNVSPHTTKSNFKGFISSFIADIIDFVATLLTIITALVVIYIVTRHSKLKTLVANIELQRIRTVKAAALNPNHIICESGLEKILLIMNLAVVVIMAIAKVRKSRIFKGKLFSNSIKVKLFVVDNHCYIPLHLDELAGNVHLLKLHGVITKESLTLRKNWIWDILEIDWTDVYLLQDHKEINLPVTVVIPLFYKLKLRQLLKHSRKDPLHLYIMLKTKKVMVTLRKYRTRIKLFNPNMYVLYFRMNQPQPLSVSVDFQGYLVCQIPADALEAKLKIKTKWGKFTLHTDQFTRTEKYRAWRKANRCKIHSRRRRCLSNSHLNLSSDSSTFINQGQKLGYAPKIFLDSNTEQ